MKNDNGFTLLEAMIALLILSVGIVGAAVMQIQAIRANDNGMARTKANDIGLAVMEELRRLPFDDARVCPAGTPAVFNAAALNTGSDLGGGAVNPALAGHVFSLVNFPNFPASYTFNAATNTLVDDSGRSYRIFWNANLDAFATGAATQPACVISLFVYWQSPMGLQHLHYTTYKYKNIKLAI
jgi:type IV pilus assembly protein PilV